MNTKKFRTGTIPVVFLGLLFFSSPAPAEEAAEKKGGTENYFTLGDVFERNVIVDGNADRFRAQHWINDGWAWGFKDMDLKHKISDKTTFMMEGSATPADNDVEAKLSLDRNDTGAIHIDYRSFRKYYDGTGGTYWPHTQSAGLNESNQNLQMDMGQFEVELVPKLSEGNDLSFSYERKTKDGRKSRLSWSGIKDRTIVRKVSPTWQDVDEVEDIIALKGQTQLAGFTVSGDQEYETVHTDTLREERLLSVDSVDPADRKVRRQYIEPDSYLLTSSLRGERWFLDDKTFLSLGYRFSNLNASEDESLSEHTAAGVPISYSNPENKNGTADNSLDSHVWIGSMLSNLTPQLSFITRVRAEYLSREGDSTYALDSTNPPDGRANTTEVTRTENNINRMGENFSLRYSGLPKTIVYSELELMQDRNWISEQRNSLAGQSASSANETWFRETLTNTNKNGWTLGTRSVPSKYWNFTTQLKHENTIDDYDDIIESPTTTTSKSAFFDALRIENNEASTRLTLKPWSKLQSSIRYQYNDRKYLPRAENQIETESDVLSQTYTYDLAYQASDTVMMTTSFSRQNLKISTPAGSIPYTQSQVVGGRTYIPGFRSDVNTGMVSLNFTPKETLSFNSTILHSWAQNFDDFTTIGLPLGADFERTDMTLGMRWLPKKDLTIEPHYAFYHYDGNSQIDSGDYDSHVIWLDFKYDWF